MKKIIRITALVLACLTITVIAAGCSVKGNTYVFDNFKITDKGDLSDEQADFAVASVKLTLKGTTYEFSKDGKYGFGYWKQFGSKVYSGSKEDFKEEDGVLIGKVSMGKLIIEGEISGVKYQATYKKQ